MAIWLPIPPNWPDHGATCYVRRLAWPSTPFLATWSASSEGWYEQDTGAFIPWYDAQRWYLSAGPATPITLTVTGTLSPDWTGTYTYRGICFTGAYYQRSNDRYWIWRNNSPYYWIIAQTLAVSGVTHWNTSANADPTAILATYAPQGTATGTATVSAS